MDIKVTLNGDKELILFLNTISAKTKPAIVDALGEIGNHLEVEIKKKFGTYQTGWPKLKRASVMAKWNRRAQLNGFKRAKFTRLIGMFNHGFGDDPLVLHGHLRDSIKHETNETQLESVVYSDNDYAAVHEYGHKNVPARSFMRLTLWQEEENITGILDKHISKALKE